MTQKTETPQHSRTRIGLTTLGAFLSGLVLVIGVILPAEFSLDPLGTGKALGLLGLAEEGSRAVIFQTQVHKSDRVSFQLAPFESVEYSYRMALGTTMIYSWRSSGELVFNLHSVSDLPLAPAESFSSGRAASRQGTYTAPFAGQHGWFWENRGDVEVTLELATSGFMGDSLRSAVSGQQTGSPQPAL